MSIWKVCPWFGKTYFKVNSTSKSCVKYASSVSSSCCFTFIACTPPQGFVWSPLPTPTTRGLSLACFRCPWFFDNILRQVSSQVVKYSRFRLGHVICLGQTILNTDLPHETTIHCPHKSNHSLNVDRNNDSERHNTATSPLIKPCLKWQFSFNMKGKNTDLRLLCFNLQCK